MDALDEPSGRRRLWPYREVNGTLLMRYVKTIWRSFWLAILFAMLGLFPTLAKGWQSSLSTGTVTVVEHPGPVSNAVTERYTSVSTEVVTVMIYPEPVLPSETVVGAQQDTPPEDIIQSNEQRKFDYYFTLH